MTRRWILVIINYIKKLKVMKENNLITEELVIVGSRYGALTDVLKPYYENGEPIEPENIKKVLGSDVVYVQPVSNPHDPHAVGVFLNTEKRLGFIWKDQSCPLRKGMLNHNKKYIKARIKRINTKHGLMIAETELPFELEENVSRCMDLDEDWAVNIPETVPSITEQSLSLGFALLCDELPEAEEWNNTLNKRFENLKRDLPADLSAHHVKESHELYEKMRMRLL